MMSLTSDSQLSPSVVSSLKEVEGIDIEHKRKLRSTYLDLNYKKHEGSDQWEKSGEGIRLEPLEVEYKKPENEGAIWKGEEKLEAVLDGSARNGGSITNA